MAGPAAASSLFCSSLSVPPTLTTLVPIVHAPILNAVALAALAALVRNCIMMLLTRRRNPRSHRRRALLAGGARGNAMCVGGYEECM
jgi:hypothetical protein